MDDDYAQWLRRKEYEEDPSKNPFGEAERAIGKAVDKLFESVDTIELGRKLAEQKRNKGW